MDTRTRERIKVLKRKMAQTKKAQKNAEKAGRDQVATEAKNKWIELEHELLRLSTHCAPAVRGSLNKI